MDDENLNRQMEFIINQQAQFSADIIELKGRLAELANTVTTLAETVEINRADTREAINNLIVANEVTRELAENVARLAIQTSQRVTDLESKQ
jgi:hypothetical protein